MLPAMTDSRKALVAPHTKLGECPLLRKGDNTLHYIDVLGATIHVLELPELRQRRSVKCPEPISFMCFHDDGGYLVCSFDSIARVNETGDWQILKRVIPDGTNIRLNDGAVDSLAGCGLGPSTPLASPYTGQHEHRGPFS